MPELSPIRGEVGVVYDAAFLYLSVRGAVAERWGHGSGFGRHSVGHDNLSLTNREGSRLAQVNLKNSVFIDSAPDLDWNKFVAEASEFLVDCLKTLQPSGVSVIYADLRLCSRAQSFSSLRERLASALLAGNYSHPPIDGALFDDLSVSLQFKQNLMTTNTMLGPMRRVELAQQVQGDQDLDRYPDNLLFVLRRYEVVAGRNPQKDRFGWEKAQDQLESLVRSHLVSAPANVDEYVATVLGRKEA